MHNEEKRHEAYTYTCQLVSQLMYCSSKMDEEDFEKVADEIMTLISKYKNRIETIKKS